MATLAELAADMADAEELLSRATRPKVKTMLTERTRSGSTVIITTHILDVAERMADRIGIIHHGKLLTEGTFDELRAHSGRQNATLEDLFLNLIETADAA